MRAIMFARSPIRLALMVLAPLSWVLLKLLAREKEEETRSIK